MKQFALRIVLMMLFAPKLLAAGPPSVTVSPDRLLIQVRPGGSVALLAVAHEAGYFMTNVVSRRAVLSDDDRDGKIEYVPDHGVAFRSIWIVVNLDDGQLVVASRPDYHLVKMSDSPPPHGPAIAVGPNSIDTDHQMVDILVVRPGKGAWTAALRETSSDAGPSARGRIHASLSKFRSLRKEFGGPPAAIDPADVITVIDPERMEFWSGQMKRGSN